MASPGPDNREEGGLDETPTGVTPSGETEREPRRRADARRNRARILNAAASLYAREPKASMRAVADAARVGRSTLFRHFPAREDLEGALERRKAEWASGDPSKLPAQPRAGGLVIAAPPGSSDLTGAELGELQPPGGLGREAPLVVDATHVLNEVPPHLVAEQLVTEARRIAGVAVGLYVVDIDGSRLRRLAGSEDFPPELEGPLAVGPEIAPDAIPELNDRFESMLPGCAPVPMWLRGRAIGVLVAIRAPQEPLAEIARQGTAALELAGVYTDVFEIARRRRKTSPAAEIQLNLLPPRNARVAGAEFAGSLLPSYDVGGDWFDFVENRDGAWLAIADAYGRGPEAAALGSIVLGALRAARRTGAGLEQAARDMDRVVHEIGHADFFATGIIAHWHAPSGILRWVTCAHPPPLVAAPGGALEELATGGHPAFGRAGRRQEFRADERSLRGGERLVLYTNGVSERRTATGGLFGLEGIQRAIEGAGPSAAATTRAIQRAVADASPHPLEDDAAVLALAIT